MGVGFRVGRRHHRAARGARLARASREGAVDAARRRQRGARARSPPHHGRQRGRGRRVCALLDRIRLPDRERSHGRPPPDERSADGRASRERRPGADPRAHGRQRGAARVDLAAARTVRRVHDRLRRGVASPLLLVGRRRRAPAEPRRLRLSRSHRADRALDGARGPALRVSARHRRDGRHTGPRRRLPALHPAREHRGRRAGPARVQARQAVDPRRSAPAAVARRRYGNRTCVAWRSHRPRSAIRRSASTTTNASSPMLRRLPISASARRWRFERSIPSRARRASAWPPMPPPTMRCARR